MPEHPGQIPPWQHVHSVSSGRARRLLGISLAVLCLGRAAAAQQYNPVYVDDSPRAWELFRLAQDQARDNVGESVRLYQELLDDYAMKLLSVDEASKDRFVAVRDRVLAEIMGDEALLGRYQLIETAEATRLLESGQLYRLAITRCATEPGLDAMLRLAQQDLESARFRSAMDWLWQAVSHPDLRGRRAAHGWFMIGLASHYLSDAARLKQAVDALEALGPQGQTLQDQLDRLVSASTTPSILRGASPLDRARVAELDQLVSQPIWSTHLPDTPLGRSLVEPNVGGQPTNARVQELRRSGALLTVAPTVAGSAAYVNEGRIIRAMDRFSGQPLWPQYVDRPMMPAIDRGSRQIADMNIVSRNGDALVTLTGHAYADAATSDRRLVCLDAGTGVLRWARRIDRLGEAGEFEGLCPHGAPVIAEGMVFVLARKVSEQLLTSCYLIALDLEDGRLRWARHVASSGGIRSRFVRPFSMVVYHEGELVVATPVGAVARIHASTGQTRWLRRYNPPLSPYLAARRPWEVSNPLVTSRGVLALRPDLRRVVLLDWGSGTEIESVAATAREAWDSPRYLIANEESVYAIGTEIRAFRLDALDHPAWTYPAAPHEADQGPSPDLSRVEIRGRIQLVAGALIVPTVNSLLVLDDQTGQLLHRLDIGLVGNPLAAGSQLLLAGNDRLEAFMPFSKAQQVLREQMATAPSDPAPALALMRLGMRARDIDLALEAADFVLAGINASPGGRHLQRSRRELFDLLLQLDREHLAETIEHGEAVHAMIGVVAVETDQRVEHLLAYGDWLSSHALGRAVEVYQTILSTEALANSRRMAGGVVRPAGAWAAQRLSSLIEKHGQGVYQPQSDFARIRMDQLRRSQRTDPEQFVALAREFPFSGSAVEAANHVAEVYTARGDLRRAVGALTGVYRHVPVQARASRLLGPLVALCERQERTAHARAVLRYVVERFADASLSTPPGRRDAASWLASLDASSARRMPRVGDTHGLAEHLRGSLVPVYPGATVAAPPDRALLYDAPQLYMLADPTREPVWAETLGEGDPPYLLGYDDRGVLLWMASEADDPRAMLLDPDTGSQVWSTPSLSDHQWKPQRGRRVDHGAGELMPDGQPFDPAQAIPLVGRDALIIVRRSGEAIAFDLDGGRTPVWQRLEQPVLDDVYLAQIHDFALVLAGAQRSVEGRHPVPAIVVVDPDSGETLFQIRPLGGSAVSWMTIGPLGSLVYGTPAGVEMVDLLSGDTLWSNVSPAEKETMHGWITGGDVITARQIARQAGAENPLRAIRLEDGVHFEPFDVPAHREWDRLDLRDLVIDDGRIFAHYGKRIVRFDHEGAVLGADIVSGQRDYQWLLPTVDRLLLVSRLKSEQVVIPDQSRRQTQHTYRLYSLSENCKLIGEAFQLPPMPQRLQQATVIDGWLLMSTPSSTLAVDMRTDRR